MGGEVEGADDLRTIELGEDFVEEWDAGDYALMGLGAKL